MVKNTISLLSQLAASIRYNILTATTTAGSGHPTSCLSAVELMTTLFFGGYLKQDITNPHSKNNDHLIFSKGHAAPLLYTLYHAAGAISSSKLMGLRTFNSELQGHPTPEFPFTEVATGSLGQGLSIGLGMALGIRLKIQKGELNMKREPTVWVLMGDSEIAEGQVWEAMEIASKYNLNNLVGILDVNRLGQSGETELSWDVRTYESRIKSFGWDTYVINNGHNLNEVQKAFEVVNKLNTVKKQKPMMIIARTVKGKGISFLEDKEGWHGKTLTKEQLKKALKELGKVDLKLRGEIKKPEIQDEKLNSVLNKLIAIGGTPRTGGKRISGRIYGKLTDISTREAFGDELLQLGKENDKIVVLDAEVGNSTYVNKFGKEFPDRFFQIYIDEENMVSVALGLSKIGFIPYLSTFAAFLTRAFDQIRMSQYSFAVGSENLNIIGSHAGVSIGPDGPSQMGLEDIAMMRAINKSTVLYPSDAVSTKALTKLMTTNPGINYLRTTRGETPVIYDEKEKFEIGGCKVHYPSNDKRLTSNDYSLIIAAGITLHKALKAQKELVKKKIYTIVVDLYSVKPLDIKTLSNLAKKTNHIIVVEDHYEAGGIGEAVLSAMKIAKLKIENFTHLCVRKTPRSGTPEELLRYEEIDAEAIKKQLS